VVVAVTPVRVVQVVADDEVDVVAVGDGLVAAALGVNVAGLVLAALVRRCARRLVLPLDGQPVLVDVPVVHVVQVALVQVVGVSLVHDGLVAAAGAVRVGVPRVLIAAHLHLRRRL
jgi:hypothetical protein